MDGNLPVFKASAASLAYLATHPVAIVKALWLPALLMQSAMAFIMPQYIEQMLELSMVEESSDPALAMRMFMDGFKWLALSYLVMAIFYPMMIAGVQRPIIRGEMQRAPFYLRFAGDEVRILAGFILVAVMFVIAYTVGLLAFLVAAMVGAAVSSLVGAFVMFIGVVVFLSALFWFALRLSLIFPAAIDTRTIGIGASWAITQGNVWRLLFYTIFWWLLIGVFAVAYILAVIPDYFSSLAELIAASNDPEAQRALDEKLMREQLAMLDLSTMRGMTAFAATYLYLMAMMAIWSVFTAIAYRYIEGDHRPRDNEMNAL